MKAVLDACVIYPPVLRAILLSAARAGLYTPVWSDRILEEWARAADRRGDGSGDAARAEAQAMRAVFPAATTAPRPAIEARLHLPDPADIHVLASAVASGISTYSLCMRWPRMSALRTGLKVPYPTYRVTSAH